MSWREDNPPGAETGKKKSKKAKKATTTNRGKAKKDTKKKSSKGSRSKKKGSKTKSSKDTESTPRDSNSERRSKRSGGGKPKKTTSQELRDGRTGRKTATLSEACRELEGEWTLSLRTATEPTTLPPICITINGTQVVSVDDGCQGKNVLAAPSPLKLDGEGLVCGDVSWDSIRITFRFPPREQWDNNTAKGKGGFSYQGGPLCDVDVSMLKNPHTSAAIPTRLQTPIASTGMVLIPAGEFEMGDALHEGHSDEQPVHAVNLHAFYIAACEVTNQQYADALNWAYAQGDLIAVTDGAIHGKKSDTRHLFCLTSQRLSHSQITWNGRVFGVVSGKGNHPVVAVSWYGAVAFANWRSGMEGQPLCYSHINENPPNWDCDFCVDGYRLPTEAEWEKAARGGAVGRRFPWSDSDEIQYGRANFKNESEDPRTGLQTEYHPDFNTGVEPYTSPVAHFAPNGYGLYDMAGNVSEWVNDWGDDTYYDRSPYDNPHGPPLGPNRIFRGGSWDRRGADCRCASRLLSVISMPTFLSYDVGFRLVRTAS